MYSSSVREIYRKFHDLDVGLYTIGPCEAGPDGMGRGVTIGRYSSIYYTVKIITGGYPSRPHSPDGLACTSLSGKGEAGIDSAAVEVSIGNDVFVGHNAIILPSAREIGDGAFIGAGSVVKSPVPPYALVMGNPARVVRYRFSAETIKSLIESEWWLKSIEELSSDLESFQKPLEDEVVR